MQDVDQEVGTTGVEDVPVSETVEVLEELPVLPLREMVVYPLTTVPLTVGRPRSVRAIEQANQTGGAIILASQRDPDARPQTLDDFFPIGIRAQVRRAFRGQDGTQQVLIEALERVDITGIIRAQPYLVATVQPRLDVDEPGEDTEALARVALHRFERLISLSPFLPDELASRALNLGSGRALAYLIAYNMGLTVEQRVEQLQVDSLQGLFRNLGEGLDQESNLLEIGQQLQTEVRERIDQNQREYLLREQMKAIQRELGEDDPATIELRELKEKIESADMPEEVEKEAVRELARLERIPTASPEHSVIRTYLDWLTSMPWNKNSGALIDIARAREVLNEDHYDLEKIKERILEYLSVRKLRIERNVATEGNADMREPILCFVGPPGVGKTSLGQSIARALNRKFVRLSLGGVRDESEIRGHRRTYIGAMPGRVVQAIRRAEANDPVILLDEIEKLGMDWRGDPSSALLEVLDPEQNKDFRDHYLDVPFDLSKVMFITTANQIETVAPALQDRMEVIRLPGYTEEEKLHIAQRYLVPKQLRAHGLTAEELEFTDDGLKSVIRDHTREAGVRNLEREIGALCRKAATKIADTGAENNLVTPEFVQTQLGRPRFYAEAAERIDRPGVATGLVVTSTGGDIVFVEASVIPGKKELRITGQLGDVMRESAEAALSYVRTRATDLNLAPGFFENHDVHIHVPGGAVPKDGPSAGVTIATALASALSGRTVRDDVAMTGEITLRGKVLPIGGLKEKALGAHRAGIRRIIFPKRNEIELDEVPQQLRDEMTFIPVEHVDEVLREALQPLIDPVAEPSGGAQSGTKRVPGARNRKAAASA
ncbi:MAG: endopeptidase La [Chloroflexota bacterium]